MTWYRVFLIVTGCSLFGMLMGGLFGFGAGSLTPGFFRHIIPWLDLEPLGIATFLGSVAGVILGGGLGCFAVLIQFILEWRSHARKA